MKGRRFCRLLARLFHDQSGSSTVEFLIVFPMVFGLFLSAVDYGVVMLRQTFLDRAVDLAARSVRLGEAVSEAEFRAAICAQVILMPNCLRTIAIEMRRVESNGTGPVLAPARCVNRREEIAPVVEFTNGLRGQVMVVQVCVAAEPFIRLTGWVLGMPELPGGGYAVVARTAWLNEP